MWRDDETDVDDWEDDEARDEADEFEEEPTTACPYCGVDIHEDSVRCFNCGQYLSTEDAPMAKKPWWIILGATACLYIVYRWVVG